MNKRIRVFDIEADGLEPTKIHCLVAAIKKEDGWYLSTTTDYDVMRDFFLKVDVLIGHNIIRWDIPHIERLLDIKITAKLVDTLSLSWYLTPNIGLHGLDAWGERLGIEKPKIESWVGLPIEEYIHRCQEDVKINTELWDKQLRNLYQIYSSEKSVWKIIDYLSFKLGTIRAAEESGWLLDVDMCKESLIKLNNEKLDKIRQLKEAMPSVEVTRVVNRPNKLYKKDGTLSSAGEKWLKLLEEKGLEEDYSDPIEIVVNNKEPNPNSVSQVKDWLFSMGWKPESFNFVNKVDETGKKYVDKIPQTKTNVGGESELCESIKKLSVNYPAVLHLDGLTILTHRIGVLEGFLKNVDKKGYLKAEVHGLTNTLRFRHKTIVNLPSVNKPYGDIIRGVLKAPEGYELCGSDMSSLEDRTKQHYMWDYDQEYVKEMQTEDFDPHLALAEFAGALTSEQVKAHKDKVEDHSVTRHLYKTANYSCTYGAGGKKLALTLDIPESEGHKIVKAYRDKNKAIDKIAKDVRTKTVDGMLWLYNPVSKFWYSLRHEKDKFSTLNQGTGVYCFDIWIYNFMKERPQITGQMHDEVILCLKKGNRDKMKNLLNRAIEKTNNQLKLNRELGIDVQFGNTYKNIH